jgi:hypothetical protein
MERDGVITGYHARITAALGAKLLVFVEITLNQKSGPAFEQFRREVLRIPEVQECHLVSGDFDYLIKARIHEMAEYRKLLGDAAQPAWRGAVQKLCGDGRNQGNPEPAELGSAQTGRASCRGVGLATPDWAQPHEAARAACCPPAPNRAASFRK